MATVYEKMTAIADNIRSKTGKTELLNLVDMASGIDEVYESGKKSEYDKFWDLFQAKGSRNAYVYAFYSTGNGGWYDEMFYPKYDINVGGNATNMFYAFNGGVSHTAMDLSSRLEECGVTLDTSTTSIFKSMFQASAISRIPPINISNLTTESNASYMFYSQRIITIDKIILPNEDNNVKPFGAFALGVSNLENITFEGVICNRIKFSSSKKLTIESLKSIITHLKDFAGTDSEFTQTITFTEESKALLEAEGNTSPNGNSWLNYISDLKWNC